MSATLTITEAAALLDVSRNTAYETVRTTGALAGVAVIKVGTRRLLIPKAPFLAVLGLKVAPSERADHHESRPMTENDLAGSETKAPRANRRPDRLMNGADLSNLIGAIDRGEYEPTPGTAGAVLLRAHPSGSTFTATRSLAIFARITFQRGGLWWVMALEADPDYLADTETEYMARSWQEWCTGVHPFRSGRRRRVTS